MRLIGDLLLAGFSSILNARVENVAVDPVSPQKGQVWYNTTDDVYRGFNGTSIISFATGGSTAVLAQEIDAIEQAVGLGEDGSFTAPSGTNYLGSATSVLNLSVLLDAQAKANADAVAAEALRATNAEGTIAQSVADEVTRATGVENGLDTRLTTVEGAYINKDGSVAFTGNQSLNANLLTDLGTPQNAGDAVNKAYVDNLVSSLGAAFNYVGTVEGGADAGTAFDLSTLSGITTGDYYKVVTSGYFKNTSEGAAYYANARDGLVKNATADGWDLLDHTNTELAGETNFVEVTGSTDAGYTVALASNFKTRVSDLETGLSDEVTRATAAEGTIAQAVADETTRATGVESTLAGAIDTVEASVGLGTDGSFTAPVGSNYLAGATSVVNLSVLLDTQLKSLSDAVNARTFVYDGSSSNTTHTVTHNLGQKFCQVEVIDSNDKVVIPDSVVFTNTNELVVSFSSAMTCTVVVTK